MKWLDCEPSDIFRPHTFHVSGEEGGRGGPGLLRWGGAGRGRAGRDQ